ncbi:hypothetical protein FQY83_03055 [Luteimonas marina]|uniref:Uncharacterized protein n=1 Tax=Luteimonas marina TaxID=488485 RepID=A0A5C5UDD9_9GAMM|nr:hypothetical protein [Luteimonas marina]TWT23622.1 hypothetical protein FQY83_03055 [Luteimonas marina]
MALYLVNPAVEMTLELYVSAQLEEALTIQFERIKDRKVRDTFVRRLENQVETLLKDSIDWDLKEPTEAQLNYAILIAKQLGISVPSEVRKSRFYAAMFLETYAAQVKKDLAAGGEQPGGTPAELAQKLAVDRLRKSDKDKAS